MWLDTEDRNDTISENRLDLVQSNSVSIIPIISTNSGLLIHELHHAMTPHGKPLGKKRLAPALC